MSDAARTVSRRGLFVSLFASAAEQFAAVAQAALDAVELTAVRAAREAREDPPIGIAVIDRAACYVHQGQPCDYCVRACPLRPRAIRWDDASHPEVLAAACTGCGECADICPARAIRVGVAR